MKKVVKIYEVEVKVNNKREESLVRIVADQISRAKGYLDDNTFEGDTTKIVTRELDRIGAEFGALFFLNMIENPISGYEVGEWIGLY